MRPAFVLLLALTAPVAACAPKPRDARPTVRPAPAPEPATAESILALTRGAGSQAVLVSVWATWCPPCREEFPDLVRLHRAYQRRGLRLVLVSADFEPEDARKFLARQGVDFTTFIKTGDDMRFIDGLDARWTGALPATFVYDRRGELRYFHEGRMAYTDFERQVLAAMSASDTVTQEVLP